MAKEKKTIFQELVEKINRCETEEELEFVNDQIEDCLLAGIIGKKEYRYLQEEQDARLALIIEKELRRCK